MNDSQAFEAIYGRYWKLLYSVACKKLGNSAEAEEIVQDIYLDLWKRRNSISLHAGLSSYLSVAVNYKVLRILAKRELHLKYKRSTSQITEGYDQIEEILSFDEVRMKLDKLVSELPKKCKLVFTMSREQHMTGKQIAAELNISEKTVESHLTKALQHLKTGLGEFLFTMFM